MLPRHPEPLATTCRSASIVVRALLANGSRQKFIGRGYHKIGADLCTTGSKSTNCRRNFYVAFRTFVGT